MATASIAGSNPADVQEDPALYAQLWIAGWTFVALLVLLGLVFWSSNLFNIGLTFDAGPTALLVAFICLALSFEMVGADELAGAFFYGKALVRLSSGPHFIPIGLMQIRREPRTVQDFQCPGEPETVFKGDDREPLPPGMVRPIRAVTRAPRADETDVLDGQMTLILNFVVQYQINDIFDFVGNFGTRDMIARQLRDIGESTLAERVTKETPKSFIENLPDVNATLIVKTEERFQNSGVDILSVRLISPDVGHRVSSALANIPIERATAQATAVKAEAEKIKRTKEGEGAAAAAKAMLDAQAEGRKKMMETMKVDGMTVLASEAALSLSEKTVVVVGAEGGMRDMMGLVKGAQASLNTTGGKTP